jgi:glycosyltransferase involved in cell wall biosynthesis
LQRAIASVGPPDPDKIEVVVVDDGSDPPAIVERSDVRVVRHAQPTGPAAARNAGVAAASGALIAFLDDDDLFVPGKVDRVIEVMALEPDAGVLFHLVAPSMTSPPEVKEPHLVRDALPLTLHTQPPHLDGVVVRRALHDREPIDETIAACEDLDYLVRLAATSPVVVLDETWAAHGVGPDEGSLIGIERRIDGRRRFREKHADRFDRRADAFHLLRLGHLHRRAHETRQAARAFAGSFRRRPSFGAIKGLGRLVFHRRPR